MTVNGFERQGDPSDFICSFCESDERRLSNLSGKVVKVSGPLVVATGLADANMSDVVRVGPQRLIGEILTMKGDTANIQVYEETSGLGPGAEVETTGAPMSVELGPGMIEGIYDGIQRPLEKIVEKVGACITRGVEVPAVDHEKKWEFKAVAKVGDQVIGGDVLGTVDLETYTAMVRGIEALPGQMEAILSDTDAIRSAAKALAGHEHIFFIGRNLDYALSLEGSLKLKEISYIHSEAYASGELKHGTISLIQPGTPVIAVATYMPLFDKALSNVVEVQARGASVLALTTEEGGEELRRHVDTVLTVPRAETMLLPQLGVLPLQLLAYYAALERGCDIDKPRNLAKSVTVE